MAWTTKPLGGWGKTLVVRTLKKTLSIYIYLPLVYYKYLYVFNVKYTQHIFDINNK